MTAAAGPADLAAQFRGVAGSLESSPALLAQGETITYGALLHAVLKRQAHLADRLSPLDLVAIECTNTSAFMVDYFATLGLGCTVLPFARQAPHSPDRVALLQAGVSVTLDGHEPLRVSSGCDWLSQQHERRPAVVVFTSGTTGRSRSVVHSHESLTWNLWNLLAITAEALGHNPRPPSTDEGAAASVGDQKTQGPIGLAFYSSMPPCSIAGLSLLHRALLTGESLVQGPLQFDVSHLTALLEAKAVNTLALAPFMGLALQRCRLPDASSAGLFSIGLGGGPVPDELVAALAARFRCVMTVGYGSTEAGGAITTTRPGDELVAGTVGTPLASVEVRLELADDESDPGRPVVCRTRSTMLGYLSDGVLERAPEWLLTGDLGVLAPSGHLSLKGRADGVIVRGARRIDPALIEREIERHPGVHRAGVTSAQSRVAGETDAVAFVQPDLDEWTPDVIELRQFLMVSLPRDLLPQRIRFVDALPLTADGAVRRESLRLLSSEEQPP